MQLFTWKKAAAGAALALVAAAGGVAVTTTGASAAPKAAFKPCEQREVSRGETGPCAKTVQYLVNRCNKNNALVLDGVWGRGTDAAVRNLQRSRGLLVDGIVGPHTWLKLHGCAGTASKTTPQGTFGTTQRALIHRGESCAGIGVAQRQGQRSACVRLLEMSLNTCFHRMGVKHKVFRQPDVNFDARTAFVLKDFQKRQKVGIDGIAGPRTWSLIDKCNGPAGQGW